MGRRQCTREYKIDPLRRKMRELVGKRGQVHWPWKASLNTWGYGSFWIDGKNINASAFAWKLVHGELPAGHLVRHTCDFPACCNPCHLVSGTQAQNLQDARERNRQRYVRGGAHHRSAAKLTPEAVLRATTLYSEGFKQTEIAILLGVDSSTISQLVRGLSWGQIK